MLEVIKKYRFFLLPLGLVAFFDITLLAMNYGLSAQLEASSININIAGRQRMLSQKMTKSLLLMHYQQKQGIDTQAAHQELMDAMELFDQTLTAMRYGGETLSADSQPIRVKQFNETVIQKTLMQSLALWEPLYRSIQQMQLSESALEELVNAMVADNLQLLALMNKLTNQLETAAKRQTYLLRGLQTIIVILILLSFAMAINRLIRREQYFSKLMEKSSDIVIGINSATSRITFISASVKLLLQRDESYYLGHPYHRLFSQESASRISHLLLLAKKFRPLPYNRCEVQLIRADNALIDAEMLLQLNRSEDGRTIELSADIRDITERKKLELALTEMAHKDSLTGLANRAQFSLMAEQAILQAQRKSSSLAMMFIDLDNFKSVNDICGHHVGDALLVEVAQRINQRLRASDTVFRIGGDEFVVLLSDVAQNQHLQTVGDKIIAALSEKILIDNCPCQIGASIGIARYPEDGENIDALLKAADEAMYRVKQSGKNAVAFVA
ncbi:MULTISPECIES: diguanylate cyclase domain-containing protein [unclassified Methylophaga]|uniref:diguanylate cyclase domain-containing protein n=1 Tax=unclassified Methylophaga TaxID=2629249 RepID=UPI000C8E2878|nr:MULTISPECIES: diguanylate cyclase [unclassified Methylophaga]MBN46359.1 diguanylate cyclase [Methylophaga sp.]|tara:strand:- start:99037 stop:100536 length:1500 start_codon:yes stop_codon:yes gene_type:complete